MNRSIVFASTLAVAVFAAIAISTTSEPGAQQGEYRDAELRSDPQVFYKIPQSIAEAQSLLSGGARAGYNFNLDCARGAIPNVTCVHKFGRNEDIDTAADEDIWTNGGTYTFPTGAETLNVVSDDANDDDGDTGARTIRIIGLDASFAEQTETVTLNGTSNVVTANSYLRVNRAQIVTAGSSGHNEGTVTLTQSSSALVLAGITPTNNQTQLALYTVPDGYTCYLRSVAVFAGKQAAASVTFSLFVRPENEVFQLRGTYAVHTQGGGIDVMLETPNLLPEHTDMKFRANTTANNVQASVQWAMACLTS